MEYCAVYHGSSRKVLCTMIQLSLGYRIGETRQSPNDKQPIEFTQLRGSVISNKLLQPVSPAVLACRNVTTTNTCHITTGSDER